MRGPGGTRQWRAAWRPLTLIGLGLLVCNLVGALGVALVDASLAGGRQGGNGVVSTAIVVFQPTEAPFGGPDLPRSFLTRAWVHWDARWYASIAEGGYWYVPGQQSPVAYFPAYPLLIRALGPLGVNRFVAGVLLSALFGCAGLFLFSRWAEALTGPATALRATALFVAYPFAFFLFGAMYSDALYLCAAVGAFYALERDRSALAVVLGAVATAARPIAPAVVIGLVARRIELRVRSGERPGVRDLAPALAGLGLAAYALFLWYRFGDALAFAHVESAPGWDNLAGPRSYLKLPLWEMIAAKPADSGTWLRILHGTIALAAFACAVPIWRRLSRGYAIYVATALGIPLLSSKDFMGLGRYTIAAFPVFLIVAMALEERPRARRVWAAVSIAGLALLTLAFAADNFVA